MEPLFIKAPEFQEKTATVPLGKDSSKWTKELLDEPIFQTGVGLVSAIVNSQQTRTELEQALVYLVPSRAPMRLLRSR